MPRSFACVAVLLLVGNTSSQSRPALERYRAAVLRGQEPLAESLLPDAAAGRDSAAQALLQAALLPPLERVQALLALARGGAEGRAEGRVLDLALVAAAAALAGADGCGEQLALEAPRLGRVDDSGAFAALRELVEQRQAQPDADRACLDDARQLLAVAGLVDVRPRAKVSTAAWLPVPAPLAEAVEVRWLPWDGSSEPPGSVAGGLLRPVDALLKAETFDLRVPVPVPGNHLLEVRETRTGRRMLRPVLVSDLRLVAHRLPDALVVLGRHGAGAAAGAQLVLKCDREGGVALRETLSADAQGLLQWSAPGPQWRSAFRDGDIALPARHEGHEETLRMAAPHRTWLELQSTTWHLMVERPVFRPGETVRGRLVVRSHELRGDRAEPEVVSAPYAVRRVRLELWPATKHEIRCDLITDRLGVAAFEIPLPIESPLGWARVVVSGEVGAWSGSDFPFAVQEFRRAPVQMDVVVTDPVDGLAEVRVSAQFASGAPAAGLPLTVFASAGRLEHRAGARLDEAGTARIPLRLDPRDLPSGRPVWVSVRATAPDGQQLREDRTIAMAGATSSRHREETPCVALRTAQPRAGQPVTVLVIGPPGHWTLVTAHRQSLRHAERVVLDSRGEAVVTISTRPSDWPALEVTATGLPASGELTPSWSRSLDVPLLAAEAVEHVRVTGHERRFAPRETADLKIHTTDAAGRGVPAVVTVAVVDEAVFQRVEDTTAEPRAALVPRFRTADVAVAWSELPLAPIRVVGELLEEGRLARRLPGPGGPTTAGGAGRGGPADPTRSDFRPTAFFLPACETDAEGRATVSFPFPDDLTRWRISVVAVDAKAGGARTVVHAETRLPLSVMPLLPRFLRQGDRVTIPLLVQRDAEVQGGATVTWSADGKQLAAEGPREQLVSIEQGTAQAQLVAGAPGHAALTAEVAAGTHRDATRHALPVLADSARTRVVTAAYADRATTLPLPASQGTAPVRASLVVFGGREALLAAAAEYLQGYPHGCVEQTCSRLVPLFAAARALRLKTGREGVVLGTEQKAALQAGMKRLTELLVRGDEGFAWWPRGAVDQGMTALVFSALAQAREAGIDPAAWGLAITPDAGSFAALAGRLANAQGQLGSKPCDVGVEQAELVVACLRLQPSAAAQLDAVQQLVRREQPLPRGLLARAGLALARASETALAAQVLERVLAGSGVSTPSARGVRFPGESEAAVTACLLELLLAVWPDHPARAQLATRLLSLGRDGVFDSTWATAAAMSALLLDAELSGKAPDRTAFAVLVEQDGKRQRVELTPAGSFRAEAELLGKGPITVTPDAGRAVHLALRAEQDETGSTAAATAQPIQLTRSLVRADRVGGVGETLALDQPIPAGEPLVLRLRATAAQDLRYVCITCPLPAGFEVAGEPAGVEVRDHQVVVGCSRMEDGVFETSVPVVAARTGVVSWPPAEAEAMYDPELRGRTAGCRLRVEVRAPAASQPARTGALLGTEFFAERRAERIAALADATFGWDFANLVRETVSDRDRAALAPALEACAVQVVDRPHALRSLVALSVIPVAEAWGRVRNGRASLLDLLVVICGSGDVRTLADARELTQRLLDGVATTALSTAGQRALLWQEIEPVLWSPLCAAVRAASEVQGLAASDGAGVPPELVAMEPLLARVREALGPEEAPFDPVLADALRTLAEAPGFPTSGGVPSASQRWIEDQCRTFSWELVDRCRHWDPVQVVTHADPRTLDAVVGQLVERLHGIHAARILSRWLGAALGHPHEEPASTLLARLADQPDLADSVLALRAALEHPKEEIRRMAFMAAPAWLRGRYPHVLALWSDAGVGNGLWQDPAPEQQDWLRRRLVLDPAQIRHVQVGLAEIRAALGPERFSSLPLPVLAEWQDQADLPQVLADSSHRDDELAAEFARAKSDGWRVVLARACLRRGRLPAGLPTDDPLAECLSWALRCRSGDTAAADRLRVWLLEADPVHEALSPLLTEALVPHLRLRDLPRYAAFLADSDVARVRRRAGVAEWRELFQRATDGESLTLSLVPWQLATALRDPALAAARRAPGLREPIVDWILETEGGLQFLRAAAARDPDPVLALRIADQVRQRIGAPEGAPERAEFVELLRFGALEPRSAAEQLTLRQALRRRALLLPGE